MSTPVYTGETQENLVPPQRPKPSPQVLSSAKDRRQGLRRGGPPGGQQEGHSEQEKVAVGVSVPLCAGHSPQGQSPSSS